MSRLLMPAVIVILLVTASPGTAEEVPSFRGEVMAVLGRAGCNQGACHGNARGKGGFQLSLRGQDPADDYRILAGEWGGRRVDRFAPEQSLLLLKPTMAVPHEGSERLVVNSPEYRILRDWIRAGMPNDLATAPTVRELSITPPAADLKLPRNEVSLQVMATFSDGSRKDVTSLAVFEASPPIAEISPAGKVTCRDPGEFAVLVRYLDRQALARIACFPDRPPAAWPNVPTRNFIDEFVFARLKQLDLAPAELCDDTTFVRRVFLDVIGLLPTREEAERFVADSSPDKRSALIEQLLTRPEFADWWALKWSDALRNEEKTLDAKGVAAFHEWVRQAVAEDRPVNQLVAQLVSARGSTYSVPPANYYRALRDPLSRAEATAQLFLGVRLQCAKCHNHLFDRWTQDDYYAWANLFSQIDYKIVENKRSDENDKHEFQGEQIVELKLEQQTNDPRTGKPRLPRVLGDQGPVIDVKDDRVERVAQWLTAPENTRFHEVQANRIWQQMMGTGIVEPIDDFRATNPPSHPELLARLAEEFRGHRGSLKHLVRLIANSSTYQLAVADTAHGQTADHFSGAQVRRLTAEQLLDGMATVCGVTPQFANQPAGIRAQQLPGAQSMAWRRNKVTPEDRFLTLFGKPPRLQACDCERTVETTLNQTFQMVSGPLMDRWLKVEKNRLAGLGDREPQDALQELYWTALSRAATPAEVNAAMALVPQSPSRRQWLEDLAWSLLNSNEFLLRH